MFGCVRVCVPEAGVRGFIFFLNKQECERVRRAFSFFNPRNAKTTSFQAPNARFSIVDFFWGDEENRNCRGRVRCSHV